MEKKSKIVWYSPNRHIIIAEAKSFYNDNRIIFIVYTEHRNYRKFNSKVFYDTKWVMERWEDTIEECKKYIEKLKDEVVEN